ncbi:MAG: FG-GAP repeat domain-containing protein [Polyangiaceae bacterium]
MASTETGEKTMTVDSELTSSTAHRMTSTGGDQASSCGRPTHLTSNGGRTTGSAVHIVPVFWTSGVASDTQSDVGNFLFELTASTLAMIKTEYGYPGNAPKSESAVTLSLHFSASSQSSLSDSNIQSELQWQINNNFSGHFTVNSTDAYAFVLYFPPAIAPFNFGSNACVNNGSGYWCAYHSPLSGFVSTKISYSVIPDHSSGPCSTNFCANGVPSSYAAMTVAASHEISEILTDPDVSTGFRDRSSKDTTCNGGNNEIGDICQSESAQVGGGFFPVEWVQKEWSNKGNSCVTFFGALNDFDGDGYSDIALTGGSGWATMPVAFSNGVGTYTGTNGGETSGDTGFPTDATNSGAKPVSGDFDGDGLSDIALVGGQNWNTIPVAHSKGRSGTYSGTNGSDGGFHAFASQAGAVAIAGDFDGDGRADIALIGGPNWSSIPIAYSNGDAGGTFTVTNGSDGGFSAYARQSGVRHISGDFNCDGRADIALVGGPNWNTIPIAYSNGDGTFHVTNLSDGGFNAFSSNASAKAVAGDFNGDCFADIAVVGPAGWNTIPVAFNNGDGTFTPTNKGMSAGDTGFPTYASQAGAKPVAGDFNSDGRSDIALTGGANWTTMPQALSNADGTFFGYNLGETAGDTSFATDARNATAVPVTP